MFARGTLTHGALIYKISCAYLVPHWRMVSLFKRYQRTSEVCCLCNTNIKQYATLADLTRSVPITTCFVEALIQIRDG